MTSTDFVVIGAGLAGASTAWELAGRGHQVTLVERTVPAGREGSSHGSARILRYAYDDPFYARAVVESRTLWDELDRVSGLELITPTGAVDHGPGRRPDQLARVLAAAGVDHEVLTAAEARSRWPQMAFDTPVLWHASAGVIDAEGAVHAMLGQAARHGGQVITGWEAAGVEERGTGYRVHSAAGETIDAGHVIVSAGGWLPDLLGHLPLPGDFLRGLPGITVREEQAFHFRYRSDDPWPTFIHTRADMQVYGWPGGRDAGFAGQKVAEYNGGNTIRSASERTGAVDPVNRLRVTDYVRQYLPGLDPEPYAETTCLFTSTPDEDFVVDRAHGITVLSPCSGHGAKFAPLIGRWAADLATGAGSVPVRFRPSLAIDRA